MPSRTTIQGQDQQILEGIAKDLPSTLTFTLGTKAFTPATLAAYFQRRIDLANTVVTARAHWLDTVKTYDAMNVQAKVVVQDLRNWLIATYGADSPRLADFGLSAPRRATLTPEQKAAAVAKRNATRKARKTAGKRQKAKINGELVTAAPPNVVVTDTATT